MQVVWKLQKAPNTTVQSCSTSRIVLTSEIRLERVPPVSSPAATETRRTTARAMLVALGTARLALLWSGRVAVKKMPLLYKQLSPACIGLKNLPIKAIQYALPGPVDSVQVTRLRRELCCNPSDVSAQEL